ncbi:MAG: hypothetical protein Q4G48_06980 [Bacteroidia bacterium]|nr:hypothetical protein [Bacteroidia bacterium]
MKLKLCIFYACIFLFATHVAAQQEYTGKTSSIQVEMLGAHNLMGVSFDQRFMESNHGLGYKVGIGVGYSKDSWKFIPFKFNTWGGFPNQTIVSVPIQLNYLLGKNAHKFELGAGVTPFYSSYKFNEKSNINAYGTFATGYRYNNLPKRFVLTAGLMYGFKLPGLKMNYVDKFFWQPYLSVGYILK